MKPTLTLFTLLLSAQLLTLTLSAQISTNYQWTWMKGDSVAYPNGIYGTSGVYAITNTPGGRYASASWTDGSSNFWLFGGTGKDANTIGELNDLWKYDVTSNQWVWVKGDNTVNQPGIYGTQGIAASANKPGGRWGSVYWTDAFGKFWLFGGTGYDGTGNYGPLNDLWNYDPQTNQWTWIKGDNIYNQYGVYGILGTPATANKPGARKNGGSWVDGSGNLWLFGGFGNSASNTYSFLNDLWKYNPTTNQWTWMKGDKTGNQYGVFGSIGVAALTNKPGSKDRCVSWYDGANFWMFGGYGYAGSGSNGDLNDLWKYDPTTNQWTWVNGDSTYFQSSVYGIKGVAGAANKPGARYASISWTDASSLWLMGGDGVGSGLGTLNDLWKYDLSTNQWTWMKGDNICCQFGIYGSKGVPSATNKPGGNSYSVSWKDISGNFWLFGGLGYAASGGTTTGLDDLWKLSKGGFVWIGVTSTDWTVGSNWSGGIVPGPNDDATIPGSTPFSAMVPNGVTVSVRSVTIITGAVVTLGTNAGLNVVH